MLLAICLASCDSIVATHIVSEPAWSNRDMSGSKVGYCYACGIGFDGKFSCAFKAQYTCPCTYKANVLAQKVEYEYESGKRVPGEQILQTKKLSSCV